MAAIAEFKADVCYRHGGTVKWFGDQYDPGQNFRDATSEWAGDPTDSYLVTAALFDFGVTPVMFPDCRISGCGAGASILSGGALGSVVPQFIVRNAIIEDLTLAQPLRPKDACSCVGFDQSGATAPFRTELHRVEIIAPVYGFYNWRPGAILEVHDSVIRFGRMGSCGGDSGNGQDFQFFNTRFVGDAAMSHAGGDTSHPVHGGVIAAMHRGGFLGMYSCSTWLKGGPPDPQNNCYTPRLVSVTDNSGVEWPPASNNAIELMQLRAKARIPNGSTYVFDLDVTAAQSQHKFSIQGGWGSAWDRSFTYSNGPATS